MAKLLVLTIHLSLLGLQILLVPLWYLLGIFIPAVRERLLFELKRQGVKTSQADFAFEVSSQGELEQVAPVIIDHLKSGATIQMIYSSPSLNSEMEKLAAQWGHQFFWYRLPLLTYFPVSSPLTGNVWGWLKAPRLEFCRYDFFPELVLIAAFRGARLFSATLKNKRTKGLKAFYFKGLYSLFHKIFCASPADVERFLSLDSTLKVSFYDFRQIQILRRLGLKKAALAPLEGLINDRPKESLLMMGSCWPYEMSVFTDSTFRQDLESGAVTLILAPHKLGEDFLSQLLTSARVHFPEIDPTIISKQGEIVEGDHSHVIVSLIPGVLCEAYSLVKHTFVGGGHGRSVHSLLEPWLAGSEVYCGPKTHRSTEYDLIMKNRPDMLHVVEDPSDLYQTFLECKKKTIELNLDDMRKELNQQYQTILEELNVR